MRLLDTITRQRGVDTGGSYGSTTIDWTTPTIAAYPAEVYAPSSTEDVDLAQRVEAQYIVQNYPTADVKPVDRIVWQGDTYEIVSGIDKLSMHGTVLSLKYAIRRVTGG
jgi:hypothetical protein